MPSPREIVLNGKSGEIMTDTTNLPKVLGRIEYLSSEGKVFETVEYSDEAKFLADIREDNYYGVPSRIKLYADAEGKTMSRQFIFELDPQPLGVEVILDPHLDKQNDTTLSKAMRLISKFCEREYLSEADFYDMSCVGIGYTTITDDEIPVQINVDLQNFSLERYLDDVLVDTRQYNSLEELIENELEDLDFDSLIVFNDRDVAETILANRGPVYDKMYKYLLWTDYYVDYDAWMQGMDQICPNLSEHELMALMQTINYRELEDLRVNLDIDLQGDLLVMGTLGLWHGRVPVAGVIEGANIRGCLKSNTDYTTFYVDTGGDLHCTATHHDGTNRLLYREFKPGVTEKQKQWLIDRVLRGDETNADIERLTNRLGDAIGRVYGWQFPEKQAEKKARGHER